MAHTFETLLQRCDAARKAGRGEEARDLAEQAVALCRQAGDEVGLGKALVLLGQIERGLGSREAALAAYGEAVRIARGQDLPLMLAHRLRHVGDIEREMDRLDSAARHYEEALRLYRARPDADALDLANLLRPLALLAEKAGDAEAARLFWQEARGLYARAGVQAGEEEARVGLARLAS